MAYTMDYDESIPNYRNVKSILGKRFGNMIYGLVYNRIIGKMKGRKSRKYKWAHKKAMKALRRYGKPIVLITCKQSIFKHYIYHYHEVGQSGVKWGQIVPKVDKSCQV